MATNKSIIEKADLAVSDLTSDGGLLNPEQAARFVRKLIKEPTILRDVRTVEMNAPTRKINKIQFNKRIMRDAASAGTQPSGTAIPYAAEVSSVAFDPTTSGGTPSTGEADRRAKVLTEQITLETKEVIAEVQLPYDVIEDNIERGSIGNQTDVGGTGAGGGLVDTILQLMVERAALDLEELALLGDESQGASDPYLDLFDGYIELINDGGTVSNVAGASITKEVFKNGKKAMPDQYLRNLAQLRHYVSMDQETEYRDTVADRGTGLGDATLQGNAPLFAFGSPISAVTQMPEAKGIFTNPLNLLWGVQRQVTMEFDKDIQRRVFIIVLTARIAVQVEEAEAAVLYTNIG